MRRIVNSCLSLQPAFIFKVCDMELGLDLQLRIQLWFPEMGEDRL